MCSSTLKSFEQIYGYTPRPAVRVLLEFIDKKLEGEDSKFLVLFSAPTSYGKSSCTIAIANTLAHSSNYLGERLIHVLPLRSIIEDLYMKAKEKKREMKLNSELTIGAQAMHILDAEKSPYMMPKVVYTTIDSFIHNLFKRPVAEMYREHSHFDIPRYAIYSSLIIFDEAHLFSSEIKISENELQQKHNRMFTAFCASIRALTESSVPVIVMTATMPNIYTHSLLQHVANHTDIFMIGVDPALSTEEIRESSPTGFRNIRCFSTGVDKDFYRIIQENNPELKNIVDETDIKNIVLKYCTLGNVKILVVRNVVKKALKTYKDLKEELKKRNLQCFVLHGRMSVEDRENTLQLIKKTEQDNSGIVLVCTQVIEAGVDIDFDILISDAAPFTSLIQRVGRIGRSLKERKIHPSVYIVTGNGDGIYDKELVKSTLNHTRKAHNQGKQIGWRISTRYETYNGLISYKWLLEKIYTSLKYSVDEKLINVLREIDHYFIGSESLELQRKLCSFVRDEGFIATSTWKGESQKFKNRREALEIAYKSMLPLTFSFLKDKWRKILKVNEQKIAILIHEGNNLRSELSEDIYEILENVERGKECFLLYKLDKAMRKLRKGDQIPLAIILHKDSYKLKEGLIIE
ncbi:CRISPR-associated helicase Cas3' [Candidatus Hecatella orcuttiae]|jgi:CRISPR-associated endonuclease/helicase Cas3|uniref:CRISPR-associated helicase Cas3' n=1 Tax=Candidatus Hecatella orcuttiae TaxID=1935119 RepID=UPI0028681DC8|nr:CRISPR-associated helicase Cas3' [Candidatus Hecatella orcuttiae]